MEWRAEHTSKVENNRDLFIRFEGMKWDLFKWKFVLHPAQSHGLQKPIRTNLICLLPS